MRELKGPLGPVLSGWLALAAAVHLLFGGIGFPEPIAMRAFHLLALVPPIFLLWPARAGSPAERPSWADWAWFAAAAAPHLWVWWNAGAVSDRIEAEASEEERGTPSATSR